MKQEELRFASREQIRDLDRIAIEKYQIPGILLMENAGSGAAHIIADRYADQKIAIFCGKGNNGGDGFVIARHLHNRGMVVKTFFLGSLSSVIKSSEAGINLNILNQMGIMPYEIHTAKDLKTCIDYSPEVIVDAIFGTGLTGAIREPIDGILKIIRSWRKKVVAIDIPSGLDANTGIISGECLPADITITFALPKQGFLLNDGPQYTGEIHVVKISIPKEALMARHKCPSNH